MAWLHDHAQSVAAKISRLLRAGHSIIDFEKAPGRPTGRRIAVHRRDAAGRRLHRRWGGDDMAFELPGLWATRDEWPIAPLNFVFLLDATDRIGRAMCGANWKAPPFRRDDDANNRQFERVITTVARACESGEMRAWCRQPDGAMSPMNPADWHLSPVLDWQRYFYAGELIEMDLDLMESPFSDVPKITYPAPLPAVSHCTIFVRRENLDRFIAKTAESQRPKLDEKRSQSALAAEAVILPPVPKKGGRPSDKERVAAEAERRLAAGESIPLTLAAFTRDLHFWLDKQPWAHRRPMNQKVLSTASIEDHIRRLWRKYRGE
jgi:hypothetical protein